MIKRLLLPSILWAALALVTAGASPALAQGSRADYDRAAALAARKSGNPGPGV